jgi:hypothetical protein
MRNEKRNEENISRMNSRNSILKSTIKTSQMNFAEGTMGKSPQVLTHPVPMKSHAPKARKAP